MIPTYDKTTPIGFIGLGVMGAGMARRLVGAGFRVTVHNRTREREAPLVEAGASAAASPREVGQAARVVFLSLPETEHVEAVLFGPDGLAEALQPGACVIDTSTISASATREFARRLAEKGVHMLDAPVSGGKDGAEQGTLTVMVGGPEEVFEACREVCAPISSRYARLGDHGAGQVTKCCNQVAVAGALLGVAEALGLAAKQGLDGAAVREALLGGSAKSFVLEKHGERILTQNFKPGFAARLMRKDLRLAAGAGHEADAFLAGAHTVLQLLDTLCEEGRGDLDWSVTGALVGQLPDDQPQ